jgi:hypothetical protein
MAVVFGFQILVDGWLTKSSAPIVLYADEQNSGIRFPWDIPIEDFFFGFALLTLVLLMWERAGDDGDSEADDASARAAVDEDAMNGQRP